jgi:NitT/TauT family transport system ATP-binding protein
MRQRAAVARALAVDPDVVFFDEPFTAVDVGLKRTLQDLVIAAAARENFAALFVTHDLSEAVRVAHRLIVLAGGPQGFVADRVIEGRPGERSDRMIFGIVEAWSRDPAFGELFDGERERLH